MNKQKSFTLIELLVVIVIIGILAGVIMISTSSSINKANIAKLKVFEESIANDLAANIVSRWKLDGNTNDSWGSNNGTPANITYTQGYDGTINGAAVFNGTSSYIDCGSDNSLNITNEITTSAWIRPTLLNSEKTIVRKDGQFAINIIPPDLCMWLYKGSWNRVASYNGFNSSATNQWYYIVATWDGTIPKLYVNGILVNTGNVLSKPLSYSNQNDYIGIYSSGGTYLYAFDGQIDDVRIYNAALSSSQIKQNYIAGLDSLLNKNSISKEDYNQRIESLGTR